MQIVRLSEENVYDYEQYLGVDLCEELERRFYRGIVALDEAIGEAVGGIIFELHNLYAAFFNLRQPIPSAMVEASFAL